MQHQVIIDELGVAELAQQFGLARTSVWRWRTRGIPVGYWRRIQRIAKRRGMILSLEHLALGSPALQRKPAKDRDHRRAA